MGGFGSGFRGAKKEIVEDCLMISISKLLQKGAVVPGELRRGIWQWWVEGRPPHASFHFEADLRDHDHATLLLRHATASGRTVQYWVWLKTTTPNYGGHRWWFQCPALGIRVGKLYLPPGGDRFASRTAWDLTYKTCQESHKSERFYRSLAKEFGKTDEWVQMMLGR